MGAVSVLSGASVPENQQQPIAIEFLLHEKEVRPKLICLLAVHRSVSHYITRCMNKRRRIWANAAPSLRFGLGWEPQDGKLGKKAEVGHLDQNHALLCNMTDDRRTEIERERFQDNVIKM